MPSPATIDPAALAAGDPSTPVLLTTRQAAELLSCAPATLELDRVRRRWRVPFVRIGGRMVRYDRGAVLRWLADRNAGAGV
jgi:hypothetical protein